MVVGEGRPYLTALVVPDLDTFRQEAGALGLDASTEADLLAAPELRAAVEETLADYNRGAPSHEKVREFRLVAEPFSVENDHHTPTMKPKRRAIEARHADLVEAMYATDR
jgi:long-chain acyl-CoA synthetase